jgi:hypothetical protein
LENLPEKEQNYHGNSYVGACAWEGRAIAGEFLEKLAKKCPDKHSEHMLAAAKCYQKGLKHMESFTKIFPFRFQGEMKLDDRKQAAEFLRQVKTSEEDAIRHMKKAVEI